jgi:hypothetical protein
MTPLMLAASVGSPEIVGLLIAAGAEAAAKDKLSQAALRAPPRPSAAKVSITWLRAGTFPAYWTREKP